MKPLKKVFLIAVPAGQFYRADLSRETGDNFVLPEDQKPVLRVLAGKILTENPGMAVKAIVHPNNRIGRGGASVLQTHFQNAQMIPIESGNDPDSLIAAIKRLPNEDRAALVFAQGGTLGQMVEKITGQKIAVVPSTDSLTYVTLSFPGTKFSSFQKGNVRVEQPPTAGL